MLKINKLTKYYGDIKGVENLDISINKGEILGFIGPNGAGKSTTIRCIMNLINKNSGKIILEENDLDRKNKSFSKLKESIGYLPSEVHLYEYYTVKQMLEYSDSFYKKDCMKKANKLVKELNVDLNKKIDELSFGNLKKVGIILALMHDPNIIILDEATSGLDPLMQEKFYEILLREKEEGKTIFFSSHILSEIKRICDRVGIIKEGKLIKVENIDDINNSSFVIVTIKSKDNVKIIKDLKITTIDNKNNIIKFMYKEDINKFIKNMSKYDLEKILVEEPSIEEVFMHYYR